jgi:signal transduction histidine kinase
LTAKERKIGTTHYELGAWLVQQWHLNSFMADAIRYHHDPMERIVDALPLVKIVYLANECCYATDDNDKKAKEIAGAIFNFSPDQLTEILHEAKEEVSGMAESMGIPIDPPATLNQEIIKTYQAKEEKLISEVKNFSLLYGTIQNLLSANSKKEILETLRRGFQILFGIRQFLFFFYDAKGNLLRGHSFPEDSFKGLADMLILPCTSRNSQITRALQQNVPFNSLADTSGQPLAISDEQILRLFGTKGVWYLPLSANREPVGLIAAGTNESQSKTLEKQKKLLSLFADHAGMCLYLERIKHVQSDLIQEERLKASSTIARKVVHEVNNPLGIIKNYLKILGLKLPEKHPAQAELGIIGEEIDRVGQIIGYLRDVTKPNIRSFEPIDINLLLGNILNITQNSILQPAQINLHFTPDEKVAKIQSEKNGLKQIFINLIKNAVEAMPQGGNISVATKLIATTDINQTPGKQSSDMLELTIQDDGPGISEKIKDKLFEPFVSSKRDGHSGLGLSIVHNIVTELHGTIQCRTAPGTGTAFVITLPTVLPENTRGLEE